jgi:hypothetical protein
MGCEDRIREVSSYFGELHAMDEWAQMESSARAGGRIDEAVQIARERRRHWIGARLEQIRTKCRRETFACPRTEAQMQGECLIEKAFGHEVCGLRIVVREAISRSEVKDEGLT